LLNKDQFMRLPDFKNPEWVWLCLILILASILRFYGLTNQSMWVDELHTMREADPDITWGHMFDLLKCCDPHPPLYFILERFLFTVLGHSEGVARGLSATCGVFGVWAIYLLGKELADKRLGLIAALVTALNYYNIYYSQEARCYIMAMLFCTLSYVYFIRVIRHIQKKDAWLYGLFALCSIYSHYYAFFVVFSQAALGIFFLISEKESRLRYFRLFAISAGVTVVGYLPWIPRVLEVSQLRSFWIGLPDSAFATAYFNDYMGGDELLKPFTLLLLIYFFIRVFSDTTSVPVKDSPLKLGFLIITTGVSFTYLIPYLRSLIIVPMLFNRYTIVIVPLILLGIAYGIAYIQDRVARTIVISLLVILSITELSIAMKYYKKSKILKTQFRQMTEFIAQDTTRKYPIVEEKTAFHHLYYLKKYAYDVPILAGNKEATIDSILNRRKGYDLDGFWLVGAHGFEEKLSVDAQTRLDSVFRKVDGKDFYDAWAQLYVRVSGVSLIPRAFPGQISSQYGADVVPIWGGSVSSEPVHLLAGNFNIVLVALGTAADKEFAHLVIYANEKRIGEFVTEGTFAYHSLSFSLPKESDVIFRIELDNDWMSLTGEDRNAFIRGFVLEKK
jgi:mannosyltransferase